MFKLNVRTIAATAVAAASLAAVAGTATAANGLSTADQAAAEQANRVCASVTDEVGFEACFVGEVAIVTGRGVLGSDYGYSDDDNSGAIVLTHGTRKVTASKHTAVTKADRVAIKAAEAQAVYSLGADAAKDATFVNIAVGAFILDRGRFVSEGSLAWDGNGHLVVTEHSGLIAGADLHR